MKAGAETALRLLLAGFVGLFVGLLPVAGQSLVYQQIKSFGYPNASGGSPQARLIEGTDGMVYGTDSAGGGQGVGLVFKMNKDGSGYTVLHHFTPSSGDGATPMAALLRASDGKLYGTTQAGGANTFGAIFVLNSDGSGYGLLHSFSAAPSDGQQPVAELVEGSDGKLYGTTQRGGASGAGVVFAIAKDGSGYVNLHSFTGGSADGAQPVCGLIESPDGFLYGTTQNGGSLNDLGTVFKLSKSGSGYAIVHTFAGVNSDGSYPKAALVRGNSFLYGTTANGGGNKDAGTIFKINTNGSSFSLLHSFTGDAPGTDGGYPAAGLVLGTNGNLYGSTQYGGTSDAGTIFKVNTNGTGYGVLLTFTYTNNYGGYPNAPLLDASDGAFYGITPNGGPSDAGTAFKVNKDGSGYALLRTFNISGNDGYNARSSLREGSDGYLYGVTQQGGTNGNGTIFKIAKDGSSYLNMHEFNNGSADGQLPSGLTEASDGFLYGTTFLRGTNGGAVFKLSKTGGSYSLLHNFGSIANDGLYSYAPLLEASNGVLYGTTYYGGTNSTGIVFRMNRDGSSYTNLHSFGGSGDGQSPYAGLIEGIDGFLYGTTVAGGSNGVGTVFRINKNGTGFTNIHHFGKPANDGKNPYAGLYQGSDGLLYGGTLNGGTNNNGTIFRINTNGSVYAVLHWFDPTAGEGSKAYGGLVEGSDGNVYGTTQYGGVYNAGTIFRMSKDGTGFSTLRHLGAAGDGASPMASLTFASNGTLYGPTDGGGAMNSGTLFEMFSAGPPAFSNVPSNITVQCDAVPAAATPTASVSCGTLVGVTLTQTTTQTASGCGHASYTITRTWTAVDSCGSSNSVSQLITVADLTPPILSGVPADVTVQCGAIPSPATVSATDNCDANPNVTRTDTSTQTGSGCGHANYTITRTWMATDACGNTAQASQIITVNDTTAPVLNGLPSDVTVDCGSVPPVPTIAATDNCDPNPSVSFTQASTQAPSGCGHEHYTITRTWTATDACGNTSRATQSIVVVDTAAPALVGTPTNITVQFGALPPVAVPIAVDNCDSSPTITFSETSTQTESGCTHANYTITRTWTASDACGNTSSTTQLINVVDTVAPTLGGVPADVTVQCDSLPDAATPNSTDNADPSPTISLDQTSTQAPSGCGHANYTITRTWTAADACGNSSTGVQIITVVDTAPPVLSEVPGDITVTCDSVPTPSIPITTDLCDGQPTIDLIETSSQPAQGCGAGGYLLTRTWTATDACGNSSSAQQRITVTDTNAPVITMQPAPLIALAGSSVSNSAGTAGTPPLNYQWLFNDVPVAGATNSTLVLSNFSETQCGEYKVVVTNAYGAVTSSAFGAGCYAVKLSGGALEFTISGVPGSHYGLQFCDVFAGSGWQSLTNVTLTTNSAILWDSIGSPDTQRFYRAFTAE